jgi:hypothetical protein
MTEQTSDAEVLCKCDEAAVCRMCQKEGPNQGRYFWSCAKRQGEGQCRFFQSADGLAWTRPTPPNHPAPGSAPPSAVLRKPFVLPTKRPAAVRIESTDAAATVRPLDGQHGPLDLVILHMGSMETVLNTIVETMNRMALSMAQCSQKMTTMVRILQEAQNRDEPEPPTQKMDTTNT